MKRRSTTHFSILLTDTLLETQFWTYRTPRLQLDRFGNQTPLLREFGIGLDFLGYLVCDCCESNLKLKPFSTIVQRVLSMYQCDIPRCPLLQREKLRGVRV